MNAPDPPLSPWKQVIDLPIEWLTQRRALAEASTAPLDEAGLAALGRSRHALTAAERILFGLEPLPGGEAPELVLDLLGQSTFWALCAAGSLGPEAGVDALIEASSTRDSAARSALAQLRELSLDGLLLRQGFAARGMEPVDRLQRAADRAAPIVKELVNRLDARSTPPARVKNRSLGRIIGLSLLLAVIVFAGLRLSQPKPRLQPAPSASQPAAPAPPAPSALPVPSAQPLRLVPRVPPAPHDP